MVIIAEMIISFAFTCAVKEQSRRSGQPPHRGCLWCVWRTIGTGTPLSSGTGKGGEVRRILPATDSFPGIGVMVDNGGLGDLERG